MEKPVASSNKTSGTKTVDELTKEVIKGLWDNGANRKAKLTVAGYDYAKHPYSSQRMIGLWMFF